MKAFISHFGIMELTKEQKLSLLSELIRLANADGEHRDEEYDMLHLVAQTLEVEPMEMEELFLRSAQFHPPKEEVKRIVVFYHMLRIVWADDHLDPDEVHLLRELGAQLSLPIQAMDTAIKRSKIYPQGNIPDQEWIEIFQVHHN